MSTDAVTLSVLTTVYNRERSIARAVRSILAQTHADFEYVIVDDGSTDETAAIIEAMDDARIRLHRIAHAGRARALNEGLRHCRGQYIAIQDSDDEAQPERLKLQLRFMEEHPEVGMLGCRVLVRDESTGSQRVIAFPEHHDDILYLMPVTSAVPFNSSLIRRAMFDHVGNFREELAAGEDYDFQLRALRVCRVHNLPQTLNTVQRSRDSMGVVLEKTQDAVTLESSRRFLDAEEADPVHFTSRRDILFARARAEYYYGNARAARGLLLALLRSAPLHPSYIRYLLPTLAGNSVLAFLRRHGVLSWLTAPLRRHGLLRRHLLP